MIDGPLLILTIVTALGCGVVAGVFFAFSAFVMKALAHLPSHEGIAAMQSINAAAPSPWFMAVLFGTAAACVALIVVSLFRLDDTASTYQLVGTLVYLVVIVLTIAYHVPRNNTLATVDPNGADAAKQWTRYVAGWTAWNHVRATAALSAAAMLTLSVRVR